MPNRDIYSTVLPVSSLAPAVRTATTNGDGVNLQGFESAMAVFNVGAEGVTLSSTDKIGLQLQESDDNSTFTDVAAGDTHNGESLVELTSNTQAPGVYVVSYKGAKQYLRGRLIYSGTHGTGTPISCTILRSHAAVAPVVQPN